MTKQSHDQGWRDFVLNSLPTMEATGTEGFAPAPTTTITAQAPFSLGAALRPDFDPIELLPPSAADKLRALRQRASDAHAVVPEFETIREASMTKIEAANALKRLSDHPQDGGFNLPPTDARVIVAQKHLDKMTDDFERLQELQKGRSGQWQAASGALSNTETGLRSGLPGGTTLQSWDGEPPSLNKNEGLLDAISRLQRRGRDLKATLHQIRSSCLPKSYCIQRAREMAEALVMRGTPDVSMLIEHDGDIIWPTIRVQSEVIGTAQRALAFHDAIDVVGLFAWLHRDALIAALDREIASEADDKAALTPEARQKAEAEVMADLLAVERDECALVWQAQAQGLPVEHRADISPLALLGVVLVTVPRANGSQPSSWMHAFDLVWPGGRR